jgi:DNA-binding NarL/FixJ family response regulator
MNPVKPRALVVEDDPSWQEILSELLVDNGFIVDVAGSLAEAMLLLKTHPQRLAIVDLSLESDDPHNTDGLRVLEAVHDLAPNVQAVLLTGFATVELAVSAMTTYGVLTVLRKERFTYETFDALLQQVLTSAPTSSVPPQPPDIAVSAPSPDPKRPKSDAGVALVVDDDAGWQSLLAELLVEVGYHTRLCSGFGEAFSYLQRESFTLAVIDLSLAGFWSGIRAAAVLEDMEGYRLLTQTRHEGIPTIVVSGVATSTDIQRVYVEQGIFAYLEKQTFERDAFLRLASEALAIRQANNELSRLTEREREVLDWLVQGLTNKEIAEKLVITPNTVKRHLKAIFEKFEVNTRAAAVAIAVERKR